MKASATQQQTLLDLQEADNQIALILKALANIPQESELATVLEESAATRRQVAVLEGDVDEAQTLVTRCESDVSVARERLTRDEERLATSTDAKVSLALEHEIKTLRRRINDLEDAELEVMERWEEARRAREEVNEKLTALENRRTQLEQEIASERDLLRVRESSARQARSDIAAGLPAELVELYDKQRDRYGIGAGLLRRGVSVATGMALTEADLDYIRHADPDEVIICPESSCILVRTEESWT